MGRIENALHIFSTPYEIIDTSKIKVLTENRSTLRFTDSVNNYSFNFSKSTLYKNFVRPIEFIELETQILKDPYKLLVDLFNNNNNKIENIESNFIPGKHFVILPLYSTRLSNNSEKTVASKSGLNQWNAGGRPRDYGEIYLPIPSLINKKFPSFFPSRDKVFKLKVPDGSTLQAKICQDNSKALMTNPNKALSEWLLRKVLDLKQGELLSYKKLKNIGVDSVRIRKISEEEYFIAFAPLGTYERFASIAS